MSAERLEKIPHQLTKNVKILQKAVLMHDGECFLIRRDPNDFSRPNCWDLPGGNSEWPTEITTPTRDPHQKDIAREIQEGVNISVDPELFDHANWVYLETFFEPERQIFTVVFGWRVDLPATFTRESVQLSDERHEFMWVSPITAQTYDFGSIGGFLIRILEGATAQEPLQ